MAKYRITVKPEEGGNYTFCFPVEYNLNSNKNAIITEVLENVRSNVMSRLNSKGVPNLDILSVESLEETMTID